MTTAGVGTAETTMAPRRFTWVFQLIVAYFIALRLAFDLMVNPMGDEAYYWMWGQHPQLSYLDHPPLHAWLMGAVSVVLGWSPFSLRALTWLTLGGVLAVLWTIAGRLSPDDRSHQFWKSAAIYVSLPLTVVATTPAFHDHLLALLCFAALYCAMVFAADRDVGHERIGFFYAAAVLAGLAVLTKYNGVLLVLGLVAFLVVHPGMRSLWRTPHPYVATLIVAALQVPVLIWNLGADLATLSLHFADRPTAHWSNPRPLDFLRFILTMILPLGPFFLLGFISLPFSKPASAVERTQRTLVYCVFLASTLSLAVAAMFTEIFLHWNIVAYVAVATLGASVLRWRWLLWLHFALALYMGAVVTWNYAVTPIRVPLFEDPGTAANFGWPEVAEAVGKARDQHPDAFLAATRYTYAAQLGFQLRDPSVTAFNALPSQYDLWWEGEAHRGQDAIIVADSLFPIDFAATQFGNVTRLAQVPVYRQGVQVWTFDIYLAEAYANSVPR